MKLAAIDIGSNAVRLQIVRTSDSAIGERFKKLEFVRIPIRLGDDAFKEGRISKEKKKVFYSAMASFKYMLDAFEVDDYMGCATSAMRDAKNGKKIIEKIADELDLKIDIISGKRESELILGSIGDIFEMGKNYLTIDVGGGSTEMTLLSDKIVKSSVSFEIGTVRMMDGAVKGKTWETIEHWVKHKTASYKNIEAVVTSGTINKIFGLVGNGTVNATFSRNQLKDFHRKVSKMSMQERIDIYKLNPDRADIIDVSADIYLRILNWAGINTIHSPDNTGLKDGILNELYLKHKNKSRPKIN